MLVLFALPGSFGPSGPTSPGPLTTAEKGEKGEGSGVGNVWHAAVCQHMNRKGCSCTMIPCETRPTAHKRP